MTWLSEWLKGIVFVVLLATFVEMLLPSRSMERYVKLVLSLLVLMTLLSPILKLMDGSLFQNLQNVIEQQLRPDTATTDSKLSQILADGEALSLTQQEDSLKWTGSEVARQMKTQIEAQSKLQVDHVAVTMRLLPVHQSSKDEQAIVQGKQLQLTSVKVYLLSTQQEDTTQVMASPDEDTARSQAGITVGRIQVPKIAQIHVGVSPIQMGASSSLESTGRDADPLLPSSYSSEGSRASEDAATADEDKSVAAAPETKETEKVRQALGSSWGIAQDFIHFYEAGQMKE